MLGPLKRIPAHSAYRVIYIAFSKNDDNLVFTGSPLGVQNWNRQENTVEPDISFDDDLDVTCMVISEDGLQCATGHDDGSVQLWDLDTGSSFNTFRPDGEVDTISAVAFSSDKKSVATGSVQGSIRVWNMGTAKTLRDRTIGYDGYVNKVAFSSKGAQLASAAVDNTIRIWEISSGEQSHILVGHTHEVWSVAFSPSDTQVISASMDSTIRIWNATSGHLDKVLRGGTDWFSCATFSATRNLVAACSDEGNVYVWDAVSEKRLAVYEPRGWVGSVAFSGDGERIVSGSEGELHIWDTSVLL